MNSSQVERMDTTKNFVGYEYKNIIAFTVGIVGTAFMAGATFSFLAGYIVACILLAIPGFIGWAHPWL